MLASIFFNNVLFARFHFSRSPHFLREFIYFLKQKRRGGSILSIAFLKKCKKTKKCKQKWCEGLQIAAEFQKIIHAIWKCVGPQLPGISNTFYTFSSFPQQRYRRYIIPCKLKKKPWTSNKCKIRCWRSSNLPPAYEKAIEHRCKNHVNIPYRYLRSMFPCRACST